MLSLTSTSAWIDVSVRVVLYIGSVTNGVPKGYDGGGSVLRWLEEDETFEHLQGSSLVVA